MGRGNPGRAGGGDHARTGMLRPKREPSTGTGSSGAGGEGGARAGGCGYRCSPRVQGPSALLAADAEERVEHSPVPNLAEPRVRALPLHLQPRLGEVHGERACGDSGDGGLSARRYTHRSRPVPVPRGPRASPNSATMEASPPYTKGFQLSADMAWRADTAARAAATEPGPEPEPRSAPPQGARPLPARPTGRPPSAVSGNGPGAPEEMPPCAWNRHGPALRRFRLVGAKSDYGPSLLHPANSPRQPNEPKISVRKKVTPPPWPADRNTAPGTSFSLTGTFIKKALNKSIINHPDTAVQPCEYTAESRRCWVGTGPKPGPRGHTRHGATSASVQEGDTAPGFRERSILLLPAFTA